MQETVEILKSALYNEVRSRIFYSKAADITNDDESRMLFLDLTSKEEDHAQLIIKRLEGTPYAREFDPQKYLKELESSLDNILSGNETESLQSADIKKVLEIAIKMEKRARDTYLNLEKKISSPEVKTMCHELANEEKEHLNSVTTMLLSLDMGEEERPAL